MRSEYLVHYETADAIKDDRIVIVFLMMRTMLLMYTCTRFVLEQWASEFRP